MQFPANAAAKHKGVVVFGRLTAFVGRFRLSHVVCDDLGNINGLNGKVVNLMEM